MKARAIGILALAAVLVAGFLVWMRAGEAPRPGAAPEGAPATAAPAAPGSHRFTPRETGPAAGGPGPAAGTASPASPEAATPLGRAPDIRMPLEPKLAGEPLSEIPHELVGAWDDAPGAAEVGVHRTFIVLVDPSISTSQLEALARDVHARHQGAEVLDVRIYDSAVAATRPAREDGGELRRRHLVGEIKRNDRLGYEEIRIRGVAVRP
jgi:hypothetical protein